MNLQDVLKAARNAEAAGDAAAAQRLSAYAESLREQEEDDRRIAENQKRLLELQSKKYEPERTVGGNVKELVKGIIPGGIGLLETAGTGAAALLPEDYEKSAREKLKEIAGIAKKPFEAAPGYEDAPGRRLGEGLGSILPVAPLALLGAPGVVGGIGLGLAAGAGEAREAAEAKSATTGERATATALGTIPGAFDTAVDMALAAFPGGAGKAIGFIRRALISGGVEGGTEAAQKIAQNAIAKGVYDPSQELLIGSGEEGAYGAGVGALASLIFDIAIPGRRKSAAATPPPATETKPLFPPTEAITDPSRLLPAPTYYGTETGQLIPGSEREAYEEKRAAQLQEERDRASRERQEKRNVEREGIASLLAAEEATAEEQRKAEEQKRQELVDLIAESNNREIERVQAQATDRGATEEEKQRQQEKQVELARLEVVLPVIEQIVPLPETTMSQTVKQMRSALAGEGLSTELTDREKGILQRAFDIKFAEDERTIEDSAPAENQQMEALIPEGTERIRAPKQLSLQEVGAPRTTPETTKATTEPTEESKPFSTVLTSEVLDGTGLSRRSPYFKQLVDKDMADPAQVEEIDTVAMKILQNPKVKLETKQAMYGIFKQAFGAFGTQAGLFDESLSWMRPIVQKGATNESTRITAVGTGTSTESGKGTKRTGEPGAPATDTGTTETSKPSGLGDTGEPPSKPRTAKGGKPASVKDTKAEEAAAAAKKKADEEAAAAKKKADEEAAAAKKKADEAAAAAKKKADEEAAFKKMAEEAAARTRSAKNDVDALESADADYRAKIAQLEANKDLSKVERRRAEDAAWRKRHETQLEIFNRNKYTREGKAAYAGKLTANENPYKGGTPEAKLWTAGFLRAEDDDSYFLPKDKVRIFVSLDEKVVAKLKAGDLSGALETLATTLSGRNAAIARALAKVLKGVKVKLVSDLKAPNGRILSGDYDLASDTVSFDSTEGMNLHTLLHEATHAAIEKILKNPSHPVAKQLTTLFNNIKGSLDTAYGATNISEFVAEAFSNPEFQQKLAQIDVEGKPISAWTRFTNAVANLLRSMIGEPSKGVGSALDAVDTLAGSILAPDVNGLGMGVLYKASVAGAVKDVFKEIDNKIIKLPVMNNSFVYRVYEVLRQDIPTSYKRIILQGLPINALVEVAKEKIPMAIRLYTIEKELNGELDKRRAAIDGTIQRIQRWVKGNPEKEAILNRVIKESTLEEVDPSVPRDKYKGKLTKGQEDKQAVWDRLQADWKALGGTDGEGQAIYKQMRDTYAESYNDLLGMLFKRIDASVSDPEQSKKIRNELFEKFSVKGKIEPYFPLMRQGDYWLTFVDSKGEFHKMAFETSVERDRAMQMLDVETTVQKGSVKKSSPSSKYVYKDAPPTSFVNDVLKILEANKPKVSQESIEEVMRVYLDTLPESSFAQSFRKRLGTLGFEENAVKVFYKKSISMAHQLGTLRYSNRLFQLRDEMLEFVNTRNTTEEAREVFNVLDRHIATIVSPRISSWSKAATSATFFMTLGGNVSSVLVNFAQVPMVVMPYLGGKYGYSETTSAIGFATNMFFGSGLKRKVKMSGISKEERKAGKDTIEVGAGYSLDNYDFAELAKKAEKQTLTKKEQDILDMQELSELSSQYGLLSRSVANDILDMNKEDTVLTKVNNVGGFMFHHGERMTRQISLISSYKLELDRMRKSGKELTTEDKQAAARTAVELTELLNGGASANSAPLLAKNSLGKMAFMYKRYGVSMYYMLYRNANEALKSEDEMVRNAAKRQLAGIYGMSALLAGVQGIPMFGVAAALYNILLKGDDEDDFETLVRKYLGEGMFSGALNYLTGTAVAGRIGLSDLLLRDTGYRNEENEILSLLQLVGGPVYGTADRLARSAKLISDGEVQRGLEQGAPAALSNFLKAYRYANEGATTLRGDPITGDVGAGHVLGQSLGFAPADYTLQLEINANVKNIERSVTEKRTKLLKKYYIATRNGDSELASEVLNDLIEMNNKHPGVLKPDTIKKSMKQHMKTSAEMYHGVTLNKVMRNELLQNASEYDKDTSLFDDED